jgi:hypothetical protein
MALTLLVGWLSVVVSVLTVYLLLILVLLCQYVPRAAKQRGSSASRKAIHAGAGVGHRRRRDAWNPAHRQRRWIR